MNWPIMNLPTCPECGSANITDLEVLPPFHICGDCEHRWQAMKFARLDVGPKFKAEWANGPGSPLEPIDVTPPPPGLPSPGTAANQEAAGRRADIRK